MINLEELKRLPVAERLQLIDELWKSMEGEIETEEDIRLRERIAAYEQGKLTFISWDEAKTQIEQRLSEMRNAK